VFALDEYWGLAERLFGGAERTFARHTEFALEGGVAIALAILGLLVYRKLAQRERQLSELLTVCAWCRRVSVDGTWISIERFLETREGARTTVSLCPTCFQEAQQPR
jgi:hypothetical protein